MSNVIDLSARIASRRILPPSSIAEVRALSVTRRAHPMELRRSNAELRAQRKDEWLAAKARTAYWRARMKLHTAISSASIWSAFPDGMLEERHPDHETDDWMSLVTSHRAALAKQLLTPAWTAADVVWKRRTLATSEIKYIDVTAEQIELAIERDAEFLAAHPMRRKQDGAPA